MAERKTYLGDGAYAEFDGFAIVLTTENGITASGACLRRGRTLEASARALLAAWYKVLNGA